MFDEIINRNYPVLNFFGKNDLMNIYEKNREEIFKKYFESIEFYKSNDELITNKKINTNEVYIPKEYMEKNYYSEIEFIYGISSGNASIVLQSKYKNDRAKNYLKYQIMINNEIKLEEDIALWNMKTSIMITGLRKNDSIKLRVTSMRKSGTKSWEKASRIKILSYEELTFKGDLSQKVYTNSPFGIIN